MNNISHLGQACRISIVTAVAGVIMIQRSIPGEMRRDGDQGAPMLAACCRVMVAFANAVKNAVTGKRVGQKTGKPTHGTKQRRTGVAGTGSALMAIRIGHNPDAVAKPERIFDKPFEGAPT